MKLLWLAAVPPALWALHRVLCWAEGRGYIFYLNRRASPGAVGNAMQELSALAQPQVRHVHEVKAPQEQAPRASD